MHFVVLEQYWDCCRYNKILGIFYTKRDFIKFAREIEMSLDYNEIIIESWQEDKLIESWEGDKLKEQLK